MDFSDPGKKRAKRGGDATRGKWKAPEQDECACGKKKNPLDYVCSYCMSKESHSHGTPKLMADRPQYDARGFSCKRCLYLMRCSDRLPQNLWMLCEIPDEQDLMVRTGHNGKPLHP